MWKKVQIAQISLNILAPILRKNSNPSHPLCRFKNLHGIGIDKELQHFCFFLIHQKRKQPFKAVIWVGALQSVVTPPPPWISAHLLSGIRPFN